MCGIVGYAGKRETIEVLLDCLGMLEYRGYDSAGISFMDGGTLRAVKRKGRLDVLKASLAKTKSDSTAGIGHTRWATHGEPNEVNSHPHLSSNGKISVVHNGIIENYMALKEFLIGEGYVFVSETDTEVISHLLEYYYQGDFISAVRKTVDELKGSFAIGVLCSECRDSFIVAKRDSPVVIGLGKNENFAASDIPAVIKYTKDVLILENDDIAVISPASVNVYDHFGMKVSRRSIKVDWEIKAAERSGFDHFMLKEIFDEPDSVKACISPRIIGSEITLGDIVFPAGYIESLSKAYIIGCGTAYHAGMAGKYVFEKMARLDTEADLASEFRYRDPVIKNGDLVIIISQSGETIDTLFALREAKKRGARILSIVNVVGSSIARESDHVFYTNAGPEIAVASTKAYNNQLAALYLICIYISGIRKTIPVSDRAELIKDMMKIPGCINDIIKSKGQIQRFASENYNTRSVFFIGRGLDYAMSMEGSLKLKEISYIHSEAYAGGELKHGTMALIEKGTLVICSLTQDDLYDKMVSNIKEVRARGASILAITCGDDKYLSGTADAVIKIPKLSSLLMPAAAITVMQLFAYYMAVMKGNDVDKPRNLAKSVTVE
jgi:glutamine---fructose-6-phosphate transaminase (isomerizing)